MIELSNCGILSLVSEIELCITKIKDAMKHNITSRLVRNNYLEILILVKMEVTMKTIA